METYERPIISALVERLNEAPKLLTIITGPRQSGKTTLIRQALARVDLRSLYLPVDKPESTAFYPLSDAEQGSITAPDKTSISISEEKDSRWLVRKWEQARREARRSELGFILVFDEIQKIPNWSETVKGLWDADRWDDCPLHVVLLGSAPLIMQTGLSESLAGRFLPIHLTHWSFAEMSSAFHFDLQSYIYFGGYPGSAALIQRQEDWQRYISGALVEPNIERDILAMRRVDKPALLKRLFELGASYSGQILSYNKMLGQLKDAGNTTTLAHYLDLLSNAGLITGLQKYSSGISRSKASSPKLNVLNTALMSASSGYTFEEAKADRSFWGRLVESTVGAHLFNTRIWDNIRLYYWRDKNYEVDFVLERGSKIVAFEVKSGLKQVNTSGLEEFEKRFKPLRCELIGKNGIPVEEFLSVPAKDWFES
ncbi:MAG: ATP-binding protein [Candidatus Dadabacteria bacterium]|nr:ATP-binding protein [Candidatus Dadabacteria bacterium]